MHTYNEVESIFFKDNAMFLVDKKSVEVRNVETGEVTETKALSESSEELQKLIETKRSNCSMQFAEIITSEKENKYTYKLENNKILVSKSTGGKTKAPYMSVEIDESEKNEHEKNFLISDNKIFYIKNNILYARSLERSSEEQVLLGLEKLVVSALVRIEDTLIVGTAVGSMILININTKHVQKTTWHSTEIFKIIPLNNVLVLSLSISGVFLLTNINTRSNTFIAAVPHKIKTIHITDAGYLVYSTDDAIIIFDLAAKQEKHIIYLLGAPKMTIDVPTDSKPEEEIYIPSFDMSDQLPFIIHSNPSKNLETAKGTIYVLLNTVVFFSPIHKIYRVITEYSTIYTALFSNNYLFLILNKDQEDAVRKNKFTIYSNFPRENDLYKLYKLCCNNIILHYSHAHKYSDSYTPTLIYTHPSKNTVTLKSIDHLNNEHEIYLLDEYL